MASNSPNGNGSSDSPPDDERSLPVFLVDFAKELEDILYHLATIRSILEQNEKTLSRLAEQFRDPRNVGRTSEELKQSEDVILPEWQNVLSIEDTHSIMNERLGEEQITMIRFSSTLDRREVEQRNKIRQLRQDIQKIRLEIEINRTSEDITPLERQILDIEYHSRIEKLERDIEQCQANLHSLQDVRSKHNHVKREVERVQEEQESTYARLRTVSPLVERNVIAINNKKMRITQELRAGMNEQAGPSGLQQVANVEGEASGEATEKHEPEEETDDVKESKESSDDN